MSCCGLNTRSKETDDDNTTRHCEAHPAHRGDKFTGCLRKYFSRASKRLRSSMPRLGDKKASYFSAVFSGVRFPAEGEASREPILFDKVLSQFPKDVYNPFRGMFTCPKNGAYMFHFSMRPDAGARETSVTSFSVYLMKEDEQCVSLYANPDGHAGNYSQSVVLDVRQGEKVWLMMEHGALKSNARCPSATFSGTLLRHIKNMDD